MSGSRWVTTASRLSKSVRFFFFFCTVLLCILVISISLLLLGLYRSFHLLCSSLNEMLLWYLQFSWKLSSLPPSVVFLFLCIVCWWRHSWLSLLSSGTLHSVGYTFPFLPCFLFFFFSQPFLKPPQTTTLPSYISFSLEWFWSGPPIQYYEPLSIVLQALCLPGLIP